MITNAVQLLFYGALIGLVTYLIVTSKKSSSSTSTPTPEASEKSSTPPSKTELQQKAEQLFDQAKTFDDGAKMLQRAVKELESSLDGQIKLADILDAEDQITNLNSLREKVGTQKTSVDSHKDTTAIQKQSAEKLKSDANSLEITDLQKQVQTLTTALYSVSTQSDIIVTNQRNLAIQIKSLKTELTKKEKAFIYHKYILVSGGTEAFEYPHNVSCY